MIRNSLIALGLLFGVACGSEEDDRVPSGPVEFANPSVEDVTESRAVVRFYTNIPTSCVAQYGTAPDAMTQSATDPNMAEGQLAVDHEVPLEDLQAGQQYYWRAAATNVDDETFFSDSFDFTTLPANGSTMDGSNVALMSEGTSVIGVSSNFGGGDNDSSWGANHAIDDMMSTEWATNGDGDDAWIELDFGAQRTLAGFGFRSRKMTDGTSIIKSVTLSFDREATTLGPFMTPDPDELYSFDFDEPVTAQSVKIEAVETTGGNSGAKEIQFFLAE